MTVYRQPDELSTAPWKGRPVPSLGLHVPGVRTHWLPSSHLNRAVDGSTRRCGYGGGITEAFKVAYTARLRRHTTLCQSAVAVDTLGALGEAHIPLCRLPRDVCETATTVADPAMCGPGAPPPIDQNLGLVMAARLRHTLGLIFTQILNFWPLAKMHQT